MAWEATSEANARVDGSFESVRWRVYRAYPGFSSPSPAAVTHKTAKPTRIPNSARYAVKLSPLSSAQEKSEWPQDLSPCKKEDAMVQETDRYGVAPGLSKKKEGQDQGGEEESKAEPIRKREGKGKDEKSERRMGTINTARLETGGSTMQRAGRVWVRIY